jgi:hypothetical protein
VQPIDTIYECSNNFYFVTLNSEICEFCIWYTVLFLLQLIEYLVCRATTTTEISFHYVTYFLNDNIIKLLLRQKELEGSNLKASENPVRITNRPFIKLNFVRCGGDITFRCYTEIRKIRAFT